MLVPAAHTEPLWRWLADFAADVQINVLPSAVVPTMAKILPLDPKCAIQAHAGDGVIRASLPHLSRNRQSEEFSAAHPVGQLRQIATAVGGKMIVLGRPGGAALTAADVWGPPGPEIRVMQAIKDRFDPQNILNPGRFVY
jgi:glycolate oxidase FAD binding subunit